ncbi:MAG: HAD family phosphatase [Rhizobiaceae bacterium]|nr:HAD family phosphatase [Rhizobiaceae bacterium]
MTPKAVFWDMDGTLIDSEPLHDEALEVALSSLGLQPPADLHRRVLGIAAADVYEMMREEVGLDLPFDQWIALKYAHYLREAPRLKARPGAVEIWNDLKTRGVAQAVVSNSDRLVVEANIKTLGLAQAGMVTVTRNDVREGKPHGEPYLRAAWLLDLDPADCAVMEDSWTGTMAGLAAGMRSIYWPEVPQPGPQGALVAETAQDVRRFLGIE